MLVAGGGFLVITIAAIAYTMHLCSLVTRVEAQARRVAEVGLLERTLLEELDGVPGAAGTADLLAVRVSDAVPALGGIRDDIFDLRRSARTERWCAGPVGALHSLLPVGRGFCRRHAQANAVQGFFSRLRSLEDRELKALFLEGEGARTQADEQLRNVVTLTLIGVLLLLAVVAGLPRTLVLPLRRLSAVLHSAEGGRTDIAAPLVGLSELDDLSRTLNSMLASFREFDQRRKTRILQDRIKMGALLERLPGAAALVDSRLSIDAANCAMREILQVGDGCVGRRLGEFVQEEAAALERVVSSALKARESGTELSVELVLGKERTAARAVLVPILGGRGTVDAFLVLLQVHRKPMD